jgi:putative ABC transport system substrate-binding protein
VKRREFISLLGGGAASSVAWPIAARAQRPAIPVIGFLSSASPQQYADRVRAFHRGLSEAGYVEGQNVEIEYRWAEDDNNRLPALAAQLVQRQVTVIAAAGATPSALAAKAATSTIPIVFGIGSDPIEVGLVASMNRPGSNLTGITTLTLELGPKRLELLHEMVPTATRIAVLNDPTGFVNAEAVSREQTAARKLGLEADVLDASSEPDFERLCSVGPVASRSPFNQAAPDLHRSWRPARRTCSPSCRARHLSISSICRRWRSDEL